MKKNFDIRLAALREYLRLLSADETVFIVEGGGEFRTAEDAFTYLRILDIFVMLSDPDLSGTDRAEGILQMFYVSPEDIPPQHLQEAVDRFTWFQNGGKEQDKKKSPKLVDWEQDYPLILPPINRIFGRDIRGIPYDAETNTGGVHWWTFLGAYNNLGDCTFAQVVRIRDKKARGKTLEKDEREWYRRNSDLVNIKNKLSQEEETTISTWLKLGKE